MEKIESQVQDLLQGIHISHDFCDYSISRQNEMTVAKNITPKTPDDYKPVVRKTVTYIVCVVLVNESNEVLMMQEARTECSGQWYLPAGRMEPGETIEQAAKRELVEETGLECKLTTLIMVESASGSWFRFVLTGNVTGGLLKTTAEADQESLQAKWVKNLDELSLRSRDILPLIERARQYHHRSLSEPWHKDILPVIIPHGQLLMLLVVVIKKRSNNRVHVLVSETKIPHLPVCEINPSHSIYSTLKKYMQTIFPVDLPPHKPHGILSVEHNGTVSDGMCLSLIISVRSALEDVSLSDTYTWLEMAEPVGDLLLEGINKNMSIMLNVIH